MSNGRGCLLFRPNQPQFFRIILADSLLQHKLVIPKSFTRNYGYKLPSCVMLKVPSGKKWRIGIVKTGGEIWLEEGWQQFVEYYSIAVGTFLVFQFDHSECSFCVSIFDRSTTEIDYPYQVEASRVSEETEETSPQIPAEMDPSRKRKEKTQVNSDEPPRKMNKVESSTKLQKGTNPEAKKATGEEKGKAVDKAISTFDSQNHSFKIVMRPSYVNFRSNVDIPRPFARKYLRKKNGDAVICDVDGIRTWLVHYRTNMIKGTTKISRSSWRDFVKDCHLQVGDVCMFELIDPAKTMLRVVISRRSAKPVSKSPNFNIPAAEKSIPPNGNTTVNEVGTKGKLPLSSSKPLRKIKVENIPKNTGRVSHSEPEQEKGNLSFEKGVANRTITRNQWMKLKEKPKVVDKASSSFQSKSPTFQAKMNKPYVKCKSNDLETAFTVSGAIADQDSKELVQQPSFPAAKKLTSLFSVVIRPSHLNGKGCVNLPWNFIVKLDQRTQDVKLQVGNRVWCVKLLVHPNLGKGLLSGGWHAFARDNCLKLGEVCHFEWIDTKSMVIKVIVSRAVS